MHQMQEEISLSNFRVLTEAKQIHEGTDVDVTKQEQICKPCPVACPQ